MAPSQTVTLETLPRDIRNNVYELLLLDSKEMYPYAYHANEGRCSPHQPKAPHIAIMLVSKGLSAEATKFLYSRATFIMTSGLDFSKFFDPDSDGHTYQPPRQDEVFQSRHLIRKLMLHFAPEITSPVKLLTHMRMINGFKRGSLVQRMHAVHSHGKNANMAAWLNHLVNIEYLRDLKHVTLDIEGLVYPHGCCRMTRDVCRVLKYFQFSYGLHFAVKGQMCNGENAKFAAAIQQDCGTTASYDAHYDPNALSDEQDEGLDDKNGDEEEGDM